MLLCHWIHHSQGTLLQSRVNNESKSLSNLFRPRRISGQVDSATAPMSSFLCTLHSLVHEDGYVGGVEGCFLLEFVSEHSEFCDKA